MKETKELKLNEEYSWSNVKIKIKSIRSDSVIVELMDYWET